MHKKIISENINKLTNLMQKEHLTLYIVPSNDIYLNSSSDLSQNKLRRFCGFTGSNGLLVVSLNEVYFFTDGRYLVQAKNELQDTVKILE